MKPLSIPRQLELQALQALLRKILLVGEVHGRRFDEIMAALVYLNWANTEYSDSHLQWGAWGIVDRCTARDALRELRVSTTQGYREFWDHYWDCIEQAAERFNPQLDRPVKAIYAETGSRRPCAPPQIPGDIQTDGGPSS